MNILFGIYRWRGNPMIFSMHRMSCPSPIPGFRELNRRRSPSKIILMKRCIFAVERKSKML